LRLFFGTEIFSSENMIAIHNIVAACATLGLLDYEGDILRLTIIPTLYYLLFAGLLGLIVISCNMVPPFI